MTRYTYADLVKAGAPELPHGWSYEIHSEYGYPKLSVCSPGRRKPKRIATQHILDNYYTTPLLAVVGACKDAVSRVEFFTEVNAGFFTHTCGCTKSGCSR